MILLLGASGYIGRSFANELRRRGLLFIPLTRRAFDYTRFDYLFDYIRKMKPVFLINAAAYSAPSNGVNEQSDRERMMVTNAILPQMIARVCLMTKTPWGHVSSGEIYSGGKVWADGTVRAETNLDGQEMRQLFKKEPERFQGYTELDEPNFSFHNTPSNFYSGTKALAEEAIRNLGQIYVWRPRLPFNDNDEPANLLSRLQQQAAIHDHIDSISHVDDFVRAALDLWEMGAPYGAYNITNPGYVTTRQIVDGLQRALKPARNLNVLNAETNSESSTEAAPESHCILDAGKLLKAGVKMRPVAEALRDALDRLRAASRPQTVSQTQELCLASPA